MAFSLTKQNRFSAPLLVSLMAAVSISFFFLTVPVVASAADLTMSANVPDEFKQCIPSVSAFTISNQKPTTSTEKITYKVTVVTNGCTIPEGSKWDVGLFYILDSGGYYPNFRNLEVSSSYIRGTDFKPSTGGKQSVMYSVDYTTLFNGEYGNKITLRPVLRWERVAFKEFKGVEKAVTVSQDAPADASSAPPDASKANPAAQANNNSKPNSQIDTSVKLGKVFNPDEKIATLWNPLEIDTLPELIVKLISIAFMVSGTLAILVIIAAGFRMVASRGNPGEYANARKAVTWAVIGLAVSLLSYSMVAIIQAALRA